MNELAPHVLNVPAHRLEVRATIDALEASIKASIATGELEQSIFDGGTSEGSDQCKHYFAQGVYVRTLLIPAGTVVVGRIHKQSRVCLILTGKCRFVDEYQDREVVAPWVGEFEAGSKTAVYAITDTLWAAVVGTDIKDPQEAFQKLSAGNHSELLLELKQ